MKKPNKLDKFNATDISLGIILAFCSLVIFFIGYHCCQRKRSKGKNKAAKRKIRNKESHQENDKLFGGSFQESDDSLDVSFLQYTLYFLRPSPTHLHLLPPISYFPSDTPTITNLFLTDLSSALVCLSPMSLLPLTWFSFPFALN